MEVEIPNYLFFSNQTIMLSTIVRFKISLANQVFCTKVVTSINYILENGCLVCKKLYAKFSLYLQPHKTQLIRVTSNNMSYNALARVLDTAELYIDKQLLSVPCN